MSRPISTPTTNGIPLPLAGIQVCLLTLSVWVSSAGWAQQPAAKVLIRDVPHVRQKPDFCGEACVASWLQKLKIAANQDDVFEASGLDPTLGRGCYTRELVAAVKNLGFEPGPVWHRIRAAHPQPELMELWRQLHTDLRNGIPSILCMRTGKDPGASEHFRLILGYDPERGDVFYHEPATDDGGYRKMTLAELVELWPLKYRREQWTVVRIALRSASIPQIPANDGYSAGDYAQHIMQLKNRLPGDPFRIRIEPPFVVISDESEQRLKQRCEGTIRWATAKLKQAYFSEDPNRILEIWLFKDKASYDLHNVRLFGNQPTTPYGYYSPRNGALVMNIATGGGTLVHEIVHPFIESNFAACPAWFNEGLGSLYEQSSSRDNKIVGLTNWRLAGLQRAIAAGSVPSFAELCSTSTRQFYHADPGTNYSQARYLCYYLQERGLLQQYYRDFVRNQESDPTGYKTLQKTLATDDMAAFQKRWEAYVMKLRFGN